MVGAGIVPHPDKARRTMEKGSIGQVGSYMDSGMEKAYTIALAQLRA